MNQVDKDVGHGCGRTGFDISLIRRIRRIGCAPSLRTYKASRLFCPEAQTALAQIILIITRSCFKLALATFTSLSSLSPSPGHLAAFADVLVTTRAACTIVSGA